MSRLRRRTLLAATAGALLGCSGALVATPLAIRLAPADMFEAAGDLAQPQLALAERRARFRNGRAIYAQFLAGRSQQQCPAGGRANWHRQFAHIPQSLSNDTEKLLPLFGYVLDAVHEAGLPSEYALIPFVESGYRPGARSQSGPAGLWQFITSTARNHDIAVGVGYDGRLSAAESTQAAVSYLQRLHGMFDGDWRLAVMGYNAGEHRILGALRQASQRANDVQLDRLSVPAVTRTYVQKLETIGCILQEAGNDPHWLASLDGDVPRLIAAELPDGTQRLEAWTGRHALDAALVRRLNPALGEGTPLQASHGQLLLVPVTASLAFGVDAGTRAPEAEMAIARAHEQTPPVAATAGSRTAPERRHTVIAGDSVWRIARRYGLSTRQILSRNGLNPSSILRPGMVLRID